ncbi:phosphoribosyltransferase family protein [Niallia circulans]|uniref:phosphoribosyltransferase family protein n=1 Tax=Niallia circulans TaxID=1397 RepID=UPI0015607D92|nr:phosphoribosyltransferase family protein [Niallia circulans]NRG34590.1 phosphoribosyltransferase domain-containing protein [Niallia circulans]
MKDLHTLTYLNKKISLPIIDHLQMDIYVKENPFQLPIEDFFKMAARINKRRAFLFVSRLLGKHLPIEPKKGLLTGFMLAARYEEIMTGKHSPQKEKLLEIYHDSSLPFQDKPFIQKEVCNPIIIGFAETATALGHSFFKAFKQASFFHTTREKINELVPIISFEEEHSHATSHRCYVKTDILANNREIILVDDELTTGKTAINIIRDLHRNYPRDKYTVASILDWRSNKWQLEMKALEKELQITVQSVSLLKGSFELVGEQINLTPKMERLVTNEGNPSIEYISLENYVKDRIVPLTSSNLAGERNSFRYIKDTGRFGIHTEEGTDDWIKEAAKMLKKKRRGTSLCVGTGEFMYIPMKLASFMGEDISYQSTTRSPIYPHDEEHYGAQTAYCFANPEDKEIVNFLYNVKPNQYDDIFLFFERNVKEDSLKELLAALKAVQVKKINIVYFSGR